MDKSILRCDKSFTNMLSGGYVAPSPNHFDRIATLVANQIEIVANPAVVAIFLAKPVFIREVSFLEQARQGTQDAG